MPKFYLPLKYTLTEPTTGRQQIIMIPGAEHLDTSHLQELIQSTEEKTMAQLKAKGSIPKRTYSRKEVGQAIREFNIALQRRKASTHNKINF